MLASVDAPDDELVAPPLLVVEVLSPSTRDADLGRKLDDYAAAGARWYATVAGPDDRVGVALIVWRNDAGGFGAVQRIAGGQPEPTVGPVPVTVDPRALFA